MNYPIEASPIDRPLNNWRKKGQFLDFNDHQVFYIDDGDADEPVVLIIHGFPTSSWDWAPIWAELRQHYRVITLDLLGFGFSDKPANIIYSIHLQADIVEHLISTQKLARFHMLAHNYGDSVAQELLARQHIGVGRGECLSACFLNGGLFPETHKPLMIQKLLLGPAGALFNKLVGKKSFQNAFKKIFGNRVKPTPQQLDEFWALVNINDGKRIFYRLITYMNDRIEHRERWVSVLQQAKIPLAMINGSVDPISGEHLVERYQELECRMDYLAQLHDIGHYPQVEAPMDVVNHYLAFLQQSGS